MKVNIWDFFLFPFIPTLFCCLLEKQTWMNHTLTLFFWPGTHPFLPNCNILPSAKWLQCHLPAREREGGVFFSLPPLPSRVFLWRRHVTQVVGWLKLLWSSWSRPTINLMCLTRRQMSPFVCDITSKSLNTLAAVPYALREIQRTECRLQVKSSWDFILFPLFRWGMVLAKHSFPLPQHLYL